MVSYTLLGKTVTTGPRVEVYESMGNIKGFLPPKRKGGGTDKSKGEASMPCKKFGQTGEVFYSTVGHPKVSFRDRRD